MAKKVFSHDYQGQAISIDQEGWINASVAGFSFEKEPSEWLNLELTQEYISGFARRAGLAFDSLVELRRGNDRTRGTWLHPKLAIKFARWLSIDFEIWLESELEILVSSGAFARSVVRRQASMGYRGVCEALDITNQAKGKQSKPHHYMNEARLLNEVLTGAFKGRNRDQLSLPELELVVLMETRDVLLLGQGKDYAARKVALMQYLSQLCESRLERAS
ncbi:KilA-N domain-containing protein [Pseudomonas sp. Irchel 3F3]|uniref:KilA-N domain-containing protein n=1 Tax=Pseudomonas sp. Irchel 3F3 TaxID=2009000 RepID=UPI000BA3ED72|nr:KilA-N domain-containing protein [Pseudomonas sp. Irchel 3F3]